MKITKIITALVFLAVTAFSCSKQVVVDPLNEDPRERTDTVSKKDPEPIVNPDPDTAKVPKYYYIPDEFKDCEFVAFVISGSICKSLVQASGWQTLVDSLQVKKDQTIALVAMGRDTKYSIFPLVAGRAASTYYVKPENSARMSKVWSCTTVADSTNSASFEPICRTYTIKVNMTHRPEALDSVSFVLKQQTAICPVSSGIYTGVDEVRYSIPASELGHGGNFLPMTSPTKEMYQEIRFHYKDKYRNCLVHFDKRPSARFDLNIVLDMDEPDELSSPWFRLTGSDASGNVISKSCQMSMWDHLYRREGVQKKNTSFKLASGINMAFRYGSGVSWAHETEDKDLCEPSIWGDNDRYIKKYVQCGYDHFRIPIDEVALVYSNCSPRVAVMEDIKKMVDLSIQLGARVVIDLHWLKVSQSFPNPLNEAHYRACWRYLHECFKDYPTDMLAYEFLNEPNGNAEYWNFFINNSIDMIRDYGGKELDRMLVCSCIHGQDVTGTDELKLPSDTDQNLIMSYHDYFPTEVTFYSPGNYPVAPVNYPGQVIRDEDWDSLSDEQMDHVQNPGAIYYKYHLEQIIAHAAKNGERLGVPVWVGEYGCDQWVSIDVRRRWFQDKCDLFRKYNMSFASWFGLGVAYNDWYYVDSGILKATVVD